MIKYFLKFLYHFIFPQQCLRVLVALYIGPVWWKTPLVFWRNWTQSVEIALGSMDILTILILPIYEYCIYFHFYYLFLGILFFLRQVPCNCFLHFSDSLLLVCRNVTDFCRMILYSITVFNSCFGCNSFLAESLGFSIYSIISFEKS